MATKRTIEGGENVDTKKPRTEDGVELEETRVLIDNYEASVIIGKAGANVKNIRENSNAFVSILKSEGSAKERVMQIKGTTDYNAKALHLIAELLMQNANEKSEEANVETHSFKMLVHKSLAGAIIGRGGEIIRAMQTETGARVSLSTEPLGASSEKTVTVSGTIDQLDNVVPRILTQIRENPVRAGTSSILYIPGQQQMMAPQGFGAPQGYGMPPQGYGMPPQGYGMPQQPMGGMPAQGGPQKIEKIVIPTICAGTVIGKAGTIIREIKMQSGTSISVAAPEPTQPNDRVVSISGTPQGIQTAIYLIRQRVESYQPGTGAAGAPAAGAGFY